MSGKRLNEEAIGRYDDGDFFKKSIKTSAKAKDSFSRGSKLSI